MFEWQKRVESSSKPSCPVTAFFVSGDGFIFFGLPAPNNGLQTREKEQREQNNKTNLSNALVSLSPPFQFPTKKKSTAQKCLRTSSASTRTERGAFGL